ncbi:glucose-1-phosphate adenylyltransferase family protein, partial [Ornithinicoccus halotolerans]|uniref:glucose-1-phosphate adenylyltransferase family protein n=1 Tax=Ornithinicoccus halotolerans TaxID=1748220 RepID=UPI001295694C
MAEWTAGEVLAVLQAGGQGGRMDVLTRERAKPAMPFAGTFRLIDFPMSCVAHSSIRDVWVSVQYQAASLDPYLSGGRPWDLDRTRGGFRRVVPEEGSGPADTEGFSRGNADNLHRLREQIAAHGARTVVVLSCDHVINVDLDELLRRHHGHGAECTILTAEVGVREAQHNMVVRAAADGTVRAVEDKPARLPETGTVATEVFVYDSAVLLEQLERLRRELAETNGDPYDTGLGDFGEHLVPALVERGRTLAVLVEGYWRDAGRPQTYLMAHRDLVAGRVDVFDHRDRPVLSHPVDGPPGMVAAGADVEDSMVGPGAVVRGTVRHSVLGPGVVVEPGAVVEDAVLFGEVVVERDARVATAVLDTRVRVGRRAVVGQRHRRGTVPDDAIVLVGADGNIAAGATLEPGSRMEL